MTIDELRNAVRFDVVEDPDRPWILNIKGRLGIEVTVSLETDTMGTALRDAVEFAKNQLRERLLRELFEDRRREFSSIISSMYRTNPFAHQIDWKPLFAFAKYYPPNGADAGDRRES